MVRMQSERPRSSNEAPATPGAFSFLSRRRFLRLGLSGAALVLGSVGGGALWLRGPLPDVAGLTVLSRAQYRTLTQLVGATFPAGGPIPVDVAELDLPRRFDDFLADEPRANVRDLKRALALVELAALLQDGLGTTFSRLDDGARDRYWAAWATSPRLVRRQVSLAFRKFFNMVFYDQPAVWPHIGYLGPSYDRLVSPDDEVVR